MKPLDIQAALDGAKVWHEDYGCGRLLCADRNDSDYPLVVVFDNGDIETFTKDGRLSVNYKDLSLFMAPVKVKYATVRCKFNGFDVVTHDSAENLGLEIVSTFEVEE